MRTLILWAACSLALSASDWTRFRGPNGTGISDDRGLPAELTRDHNVVWKQKAPKGHSSPIVVQGRLFITGHEGDERIVLCYKTTDGSLLWKKSVPKGTTEAPNPLNGLTTPTPVSDGSSVFAFFPDFGLVSYDLDGKERWRTPMGPFGAIQGMAVSPIYVDGNVVLLVDTPEQAYLQAFDGATGKPVWRTERPTGFLGSYATPSVYKPSNGLAQIVVAGAVELTGYQAKTGERLWWARGVTWGPASLPLIIGEYVYTVEPQADGGGAPPFSQMLQQYDKNKTGKVDLKEIPRVKLQDQILYRLLRAADKISGNGDGVVTEEEWNQAFNPAEKPGGMIRTRLDGKGDVTRTNVGWHYTKGVPYVNAALLYDRILYVIRGGGILATFDPESGKLLREERLKDAIGDYYSQLVAGDGKIYFINKDGKTTVISAGADWKVLSSGDLDEQVIATPAIAGSRIYVRAEETLYCFGAKS